MISLEQYRKILDRGLLLDHYVILCSIRDGKEIPKGKRVDGFLNLLNKKGFIEDEELTEKAYELIDIHPNIVINQEVVQTPAFDFIGWVNNLHEKCRNRIKELTGNYQVMSKINKSDRKGYPFLPNLQDFTKKLYTCINKYRIKDMDKVEKTILSHIDNCNNSGNWFPLMKYFILKNGEGSEMVTAMENNETSVPIYKSNQKFL